MGIISWRSEYKIGNQQVDGQHEHLLGLANKLCEDDSDKEMLKNIEILHAYTILHYKDEETLMKRCNYPNYLSHKKDHDLLLKQMNDFIEQLKEGRKEVKEIKPFIGMWLLDHVFGADAKFGEFLRSSHNN